MSEQGTPAVGNSLAKKPLPEWIFTGVVVAIELLNFIVAPGYLRPFLSVLAGKFLVIVATIWQIIGLLLICIPASPFLRLPAIVRWIIVPMFFVAPLLILLFLGPAIVTICDALGPVMEK